MGLLTRNIAKRKNRKKEAKDMEIKARIVNVNPMAKPRMTRRDKWKKRPIVDKYNSYKDQLRAECKRVKYTIGETLCFTAVIEMPMSWSNKKKREMTGTKHQQTPDLDNIIKGIQDTLCEQDNFIHCYKNCRKIWGEKGSIIFYQ